MLYFILYMSLYSTTFKISSAANTFTISATHAPLSLSA